jgi:hypothetical protein
MRVALRYVSSPPLRTGHATFTASGSPEIGIPRPGSPLGSSYCFPFMPISFDAPGIRRASALRKYSNTVNLLDPFALWLAFPSSDY